MTIVDFLLNVYRFKPFKEEKGNMMRYIINPLNVDRKKDEKILSNLIGYCKDYISEKEYELEL